MCKHVAAVLYGIGARLDEQPELVFKLRAVDESELIASAAKGRTLATKTSSSAKILDGDDLSALFGLEMAGTKLEAKAKSRVKDPMGLPAKKKPTDKGLASAKKSINKLAATAKAPGIMERPPYPGKRKAIFALRR